MYGMGERVDWGTGESLDSIVARTSLSIGVKPMLTAPNVWLWSKDPDGVRTSIAYRWDEVKAAYLRLVKTHIESAAPPFPAESSVAAATVSVPETPSARHRPIPSVAP